ILRVALSAAFHKYGDAPRAARREEGEYPEDLTDEQPREAGCIAGRMPPYLWKSSLSSLRRRTIDRKAREDRKVTRVRCKDRESRGGVGDGRRCATRTGGLRVRERMRLDASRIRSRTRTRLCQPPAAAGGPSPTPPRLLC